MSEPAVNFLGIPIDGKIVKPDSRVPQRPLSDLEPLIRAVIDDPTINSFGWRQYTPYFNDGEPCIFHTCEPWFKTVDDVTRPAPTAEQLAALNAMQAAVGAGLLDRRTYDKAYADVHGDPDSEDDGDNERYTVGYGSHPTLGKRDYRWDGFSRIDLPYEGPDEARYDRCKALSDAIESGAFNEVLLNAFGDHADVTVRRTGISVSFYEHD